MSIMIHQNWLGKDLVVSLFFPGGIDVIFGDPYLGQNTVDSCDVQNALHDIGIPADRYHILDAYSGQLLNYGWAVVEFKEVEDLVMAKLSYINVDRTEESVKRQLALQRRGIKP